MNIICAICGQSYGNSDEVRVCAHENPQGRWAGSIQSEVLHVESKPPAASPPLTSVPPQEQPYRSRPEHDLFISVGPNVEAWNDNSATAGGILLLWQLGEVRHVESNFCAVELEQSRRRVGIVDYFLCLVP